jgi:ABC-type multidrug transport system fused ATPase/permease subunit
MLGRNQLTTEQRESTVSFWELFWIVVSTFLFFAYLMMLFSIFADIFRDDALGGWGKALWSVFLIFMPFLGALVYLIARGGSMAERSMKQTQEYQAAQADYIRTVAGSSSTSPADQVAQAKALLDSGAITADEYAVLKAKALA